MPRPTYIPPPNDPPVVGSPTFAANADGFLSWFPTFGDYNEALADWYQTGFAKELTNGTAALPSMAFANDPDTGLYWAGANTLGFSAGGTRRTLLSNTAMQVDVPITGTAVTQSATDTTVGRVTKTGDGGLLRSSGGLNVADFNAFNTPTGFYNYVGTTPNIASRPAGVSTFGTLLVERYDADNVKQTLTDTVSPYRTYTRTSDNGVWQPWERLITDADIVGTVSQSGGVPTGAVIQRGSNSNGEYVRFADGTMICTGVGDAVAVTTAKGALYGGDAAYTWTYPAVFVEAPVVSGSAGQTLRWVSYDKSYAANVGYRLLAHASNASLVSPSHIAIGRWY